MNCLATCSIKLRCHGRRWSFLISDKLKTVLPVLPLKPSDRAATEPTVTIPKYQMGVQSHTLELYRGTTISSSISDFISVQTISGCGPQASSRVSVSNLTQKPKDLSPIRPERRSHSHDHSGLHNDPCRRSDICSVRLLA